MPKEDSIRANWELGVKKGFAEFQEQATNVYGNVAQFINQHSKA